MPVPLVVHRRPQLFGRHHLLDAPDGRNLRARACLRIKTKGTAILLVFVPIDRRNIFVGTIHLHPGWSRDLADITAGGDEQRSGRILFFQHLVVSGFQFGFGIGIAAGGPGQDGRMISQPANLVFQVDRQQIHLFRRQFDTALFHTHIDGLRRTVHNRLHLQSEVVWPLPLATPAHQHQDAVFVAQVKNMVVVSPDSFEPDRVHVHLLHHPDLCRIFFRHVAEEKIIDPSATLDQHLTAINLVSPDSILREIGLNLTDAKSCGMLICQLMVRF